MSSRKIVVQALATNEVEVFVESLDTGERKPVFLCTEDARRLRDALSAAIKVQNCLEQVEQHRRALARLNDPSSVASDAARLDRAEARLSAARLDRAEARLSAAEAAPPAREA